MARMIQTPRSRKGWFGWAVLTLGAMVAVKAFWPAADKKVDELSAKVKEAVNSSTKTT